MKFLQRGEELAVQMEREGVKQGQHGQIRGATGGVAGRAVVGKMMRHFWAFLGHQSPMTIRAIQIRLPAWGIVNVD